MAENPSRPAAAKKPPSIPPHPLAVIRRAQAEFGITSAIVGISCGKDSIAALSVCAEAFGTANLVGYFMYIVRGLSFQERYLAYIENRFNITIHRIPHFQLSTMLRGNTMRFRLKGADKIAAVKPRHIDAHLRKLTGLEWIASGEKAIDSVERNAMLRHCGGIDTKRRRIFPLTYWSHSTVFNHLKSRRIALAPEYSQAVGAGGTVGNPADLSKARSFGGLQFRDIAWIKEKHPDDYEKIRAMFPLIDAQLLRYQERAKATENGQEEIGDGISGG